MTIVAHFRILNMLILAVESHRHKSIGTYLRCASAFGAQTIAVVGSTQFSTHGAHGAQNHVQIVHFYYWSECVEFCRSQGCAVFAISPCAVVQNETISQSIDQYKFRTQSACFIVADNDGLTREHLDAADEILHVDIPEASFADKVMYDAKVAICLHQFAVAAGMEARKFENEKHELGQRDFRRPKTIKAGRNNARTGGEGADAYTPDEPLDNLFS